MGAEDAPTSSLGRVAAHAWTAYAARAGRYQSEVLLTLVYYVVFGPSVLAARLTGKRLLPYVEGPASTYWVQRPAADTRLVAHTRQF